MGGGFMETVPRIAHLLANVVSVLLLTSVLTGQARAAPLAFGANHYDFVPAVDISWAAAAAAAAGMTHLGVNGHLATVTSGPEDTFLAGLVSPFPNFAGGWLGGSSTHWLVGPETGQAFTYTNWGGIEPNNPPSNVYKNIGALFAGIAPGQWADAAGGLSDDGDPIKGYFVEFEGTAAVPLPGALPLFAGGLALLGMLGWRRKRRELSSAT
jgi:hypothetical protein